MKKVIEKPMSIIERLALLRWIINSLLTDKQLDVIPNCNLSHPYIGKTIRQLIKYIF